MARIQTTLLSVVVSLLAACLPATSDASDVADPTRTPAAPSDEPAPSEEATSEPSVGGTPEPTVAPTPPRGEAEIPFGLLPYGQWAVVTGNGLRVRHEPGTTASWDVELAAGESLFLTHSGVVTIDGFHWYQVLHGAVVAADGTVHADGGGWIAGMSSEDASQTFIDQTSHSCPEIPINAETYAGLSGWALESCETGELVNLMGMLDQPIHGPISPFDHEPEWMRFSPWYLTDPEEADDVFLARGWAFAIHFPPDVDTSAFQRGDLITVSGHINDPAADDCRVIAREGGPAVTPGMTQAFELACRVVFVVDRFEITGHIDLPEL